MSVHCILYQGRKYNVRKFTYEEYNMKNYDKYF